MYINKHKLLKTILSTTMALTAFTNIISASAIRANIDDFDDNTPYVSGICGEGAEWLINSDNSLIIFGTGSMQISYKYGISKRWGWEKLSNDIKEVVIENGIISADLNYSSSAIKSSLTSVSKIILPPSLTKLENLLSKDGYKNLKDIYVYSKNISDASTINNTLYNRWSKVDTVWHVYKGSTTEVSLRENLLLNDNQIQYIPDNEQMPTVNNRTPVELEPVTDTSGPAGLTSKYEWDETNKTLTFSGKGVISIADYYKNYAEETEHIIIESGITEITSNTNFCGVTGDFAGTYDPDYCGAFTGFTSLQDVQLPDTLQAIPDSAFYGTSLEEINFPDTLSKIGESAFGYCSKLKSINLHEGMTIGGGAFVGCESLKEVIIPKKIKFNNVTFDSAGMSRAPSTFSTCTGLEKVVIEDGTPLVDGFGAVYCQNGLPDQFFLSCSKLTTVIIRGNIENIGSSAYRLCPLLTDMYFYNTGLNTITPKDTDNNKISIDCSNDPTFHVVKGSTTEQTLKDAGYLNDDNTKYIPNINELQSAIDEAEKIDTTKYTNATLVSNLKTALENAKSVRDNLEATQENVDAAVKALNDAISALTKPDTPVTPTIPTGNAPIVTTTRSPEVVKKDKDAAKELMKQAKITKLKVKSKSKKKITVTWKKVSKAKGYQVQVSKKQNFKKKIINKFTTKKKLTINKKIKSGKTYFVRVRAYATYKDAFGKPQKVYSKWNKKLRKVKVK